MIDENMQGKVPVPEDQSDRTKPKVHFAFKFYREQSRLYHHKKILSFLSVLWLG